MKHLFLLLFTLVSVSVGAKEVNINQEDFVIKLDSTSVMVKDNGSGTFSICKTIKINTLAGCVKNSVLVYNYDPLTAFAEFKKVLIHHKDGKTEQVAIDKACDYVAPARAIYWGARQIMIGINGLVPGDELEYTIEKKGFTYALLGGQEDRFVPPMRGQFYDIIPFWVEIPTTKKVYQIIMPKSKPLQFTFYQGTCTTSVRFKGDKTIYKFTKADIAPFKKEPNMVNLFDVAPKLMTSTTPRWEEKSLWFNKVNEDYGSFDSTPEAEQKVNEIIKGKKDDMEKIAALTHWVADNIRYSGLTMGKGEGFTLHNLKMNFTDRCGVCKDIAGTLIGFLRIAGFEAYPAMTMAGSRVESIPADHFNHCVCVVKLKNGTYMPIDPTWVPFVRELWSSAEQQQNYLPGIPEGSDLCKTPVSVLKNHFLRIKATNKLHTNGTLTGKFVVTAEGQTDSSLRRIFTTGWQSDWKNHLEKELLNVSPKAQLTSVSYGRNPKDYQKAPLKMVYSYKIPNYAIVAKNTLLLKPLVMNNLFNSVKSYLAIANLKQRKYGFRDRCSRLIQLNETITIPKGYKLVGNNLEDNIISEVADFKGSLQQKNNLLILKQSLSLKKRIYEATDWKDFQMAVNKHKDYGQFIILNK